MSRKQIDSRCARARCLWPNLATTLGAALWATGAFADGIPGAQPGDAALTCEQIYAQGPVESQRDQQTRDEKAQAVKLRINSLSRLEKVVRSTQRCRFVA